jgi:hypothetical protein
MNKYMVQGKLKETSGTIFPFGVEVYAEASTEAEKIVRYMFKGSGVIVMKTEIKNEAGNGS